MSKLAVYQEPKIIEYCNKIRQLCRNEIDPKVLSRELIKILKNLNRIKSEAKRKISIYIIEESSD